MSMDQWNLESRLLLKIFSMGTCVSTHQIHQNLQRGCFYYYSYTLFLPKGKVRPADKLQVKAATILPLGGLDRSRQDPINCGHRVVWQRSIYQASLLSWLRQQNLAILATQSHMATGWSTAWHAGMNLPRQSARRTRQCEH